MLVEIVVAAGVVVVLGSSVAALVRRRRRRLDSVGSFSAAVAALRRIAATGPETPVLATVEGRTETTPAVHVLDDVHVLSLERARPRTGRRAHRQLPDEAIARRPVIASLPSISAPARTHGSDSRAG